MKEEDLNKQSIENYEELLQCAIGYKGRFSVPNMYDYMMDRIEKIWDNKNFPYCAEYFSEHIGCENCPLGQKATTLYEIEHVCCGGLWNKIDKSKDQEEFIQNLEGVLKYLNDRRVILLKGNL